MSKRKPIKISRSDYARVLITETLPYETPIIFSSGGLYDQVKAMDGLNNIQNTFLRRLILGEDEPRASGATVPLLYKIRKNSKEFRRLALIHPRAQWRIKQFYEKYEKLILHHCSISPASIRAPQKVAGSFYKKSSWERLNQYKTDTVSVMSLDELTKHSPSFFTYRNFDRLYKFFESRDFFELEKKYELMWTLDVSKCFDSIYTHCLSWAIKDKEFTKKHVNRDSTFAQEFDALMQFANHSETNGIVIGPEVSRVFAEIILQRVDVKVIQRLANDGSKLEFNKDYTFRRYVDDVFIFAKRETDAAEVYECYSDALVSFNLHANSAKSTRLERPFMSQKSRLIHAVGVEVNSFLEKFLHSDDETSILSPGTIRSPWALTRSFISTIKALCTQNSVHYDELSSYLIAVLAERTKKLVSNELADANEYERRDYLNALLVLLDVIYFLYGVSPTVAGSYKLCTSVILAIRFAQKHLPDHYPTLAQRIYELTEAHLTEERQSSARNVDGFLPLETLNVLLAVRELGDDYLLPETTVSGLLNAKKDCLSYFEIMCCLYYVRDSVTHSTLRARAIKSIETKLSDLSDVLRNSEKAYLLLDALCCPFVPEKKKREWIRESYSKAFQASAPAKNEIVEFISSLANEQWHVSWTDVDLLSLLEKKELKQVYQ